MRQVLIAILSVFALSAAHAATVNIEDLETFLGLSSGTFDSFDENTLPPGDGAPAENISYNASAISMDLTVSNGDVLKFDWAMLTDEGGAPPDYVFYSITGPGSTNDLMLLENSETGSFQTSTTPFISENATFTTSSYTFPRNGLFTVGFGAVNANDDGVVSGLLLDNVHFDPGGTVPNGGFENGDFSSWNLFGSDLDPYQIHDSAFGKGPTEGTFDALIVTPPPPVPEPGTLALLGIAGLGIIGRRRKQRS